MAEFIAPSQPCPSSAIPRKNGCERQLPPETQPTAAPAITGVCTVRGIHPRKLPSPGHKRRWDTTPSFRHRPATGSAREGEDIVCTRDVSCHPTAILSTVHRERLRSVRRLYKAASSRHVRHVAASQEGLRSYVSGTIGHAAKWTNTPIGPRF